MRYLWRNTDLNDSQFLTEAIGGQGEAAQHCQALEERNVRCRPMPGGHVLQGEGR